MQLDLSNLSDSLRLVRVLGERGFVNVAVSSQVPGLSGDWVDLSDELIDQAEHATVNVMGGEELGGEVFVGTTLGIELR